MLNGFYVNQLLCEKEKISGNAAIVFETIKKLMNLTYIKKILIDDEVYTVLHQKMILLQIPFFVSSKRTLSRALAELKDAGLIKSNDNNMQPAYAFTQKADSYSSPFEKSNDGELDTDANKIQKKKKPLFELKKLTAVVDLTPNYYKLLAQHCADLSTKHDIPKDEFQKFIEYHGSKGTKFKNYILAFYTWIRNYKKYNKIKVDKDNGLYQQ